MHSLIKGAVAGLVGTATLELMTNTDIVVRARPPSQIPAEMAGRLANFAGLELGNKKQAARRTNAAGAVMGYLTGAMVGTAYGMLAGRMRTRPLWVGGPTVSALAMAGANLPAIAMGITKPTTWTASDWLSDLVPHLAYGFATAAAFEALSNSEPPDQPA